MACAGIVRMGVVPEMRRNTTSDGEGDKFCQVAIFIRYFVEAPFMLIDTMGPLLPIVTFRSRFQSCSWAGLFAGRQCLGE